jgi:aspartokinase
MEIRNKVRGIAIDQDVAKITVVGVPRPSGIAAGIFVPLAEAGSAWYHRPERQYPGR